MLGLVRTVEGSQLLSISHQLSFALRGLDCMPLQKAHWHVNAGNELQSSILCTIAEACSNM